MPPKPASAGSTAKASADSAPIVAVTFKLKAVPTFDVTVRGKIRENKKGDSGEGCKPLPTPAHNLWLFKLVEKYNKERIFRIELPSDAAAADAIKELTSGRWTITTTYAAPNTLTATTYRGLYLPPSVGPLLLEASPPKAPLPSSDTIEAALQPHVVEAVVRYAISKTFPDAARIALVGRVWVMAVGRWMTTPRLEGTKLIEFPLRETTEMWTGLPAALGYSEVFQSPDDAAALLALLRAKIQPAPDAVQELGKGYSYDDEESGFFYSLDFRAFKLVGVPDATFVWGDYSFGVDDAGHFHALHMVEGTDRRFRLLLDATHGEPTPEEGSLHLPRFLALRARLRAAIPALTHVPDALLVALLCAAGGMDAYPLRYVTGKFAFTRLLDNHPERGDGEATEAERKRGLLDYLKDVVLPRDVGTGRGDDVLPDSPHDYYEDLGWRNMQGLGYPDLGRRALTSYMEKTVALLTAFHSSA